jgi:hypothetical protein
LSVSNQFTHSPRAKDPSNWAKEETMSVVLSRRSVTTAAMFGLAADMGLSSVPGGAQGVKPMQSPITGNEDLGE